MAEILLASSFYMGNDPKQVEKTRPYPPLATLFAAALLREGGYEVALFDAMLAQGEHEFAEALEAHRPRFVVLYEDSFNFLSKMCLDHARQAALRMAAMSRDKGARVLAAGSDVTDHPHPYLEHGIEACLVGEADHTVREVLDAMTGRSDTPVGSIAGLALPDPAAADGVRLTSAREPERHPDTFPLPAWELVDGPRYRAAWNAKHGFFSVNMVSTRGCPFHCNWCAKPIWGRRYAMRSPANVAEELALVKRVVAPDHVWFADDIFGLQPRWVAELAQEIESRDAKIPFTIQTRADLMTEVAVVGLAHAGCKEAWLGAESGSQKILDAMDKGTKVEQIVEATRRLQDAGIRACWFLQFGYPGETFDDILATVSLVRDHLPDDVGVSVSYPLPGTRFYEMVQAELGDKTHWQDSNDLAMMFQGTYQTPFYRKLRQVVHGDLDLRHRLAKGEEVNGELDRLTADWLELGRLEATAKSVSPTSVHKGYGDLPAPDLSRTWN